MQEYNVVSLLTKFSGDVVIGAVVACVFAIAVKKISKTAAKILLAVAFVCAFAITCLLDYFVFSRSPSDCISGGMTAGALASVLTAFVRKTAFTDKETLKADIEKLLSSIILSDKLDGVVDGIIEKIKNSKAVEKEQIRALLKDCLDGGTDDITLDALTDLICGALSVPEKSDLSDREKTE